MIRHRSALSLPTAAFIAVAASHAVGQAPGREVSVRSAYQAAAPEGKECIAIGPDWFLECGWDLMYTIMVQATWSRLRAIDELALQATSPSLVAWKEARLASPDVRTKRHLWVGFDSWARSGDFAIEQAGGDIGRCDDSSLTEKRGMAEKACSMLFGPTKGIVRSNEGWSPVPDIERICLEEILDARAWDSGVYRAWAKAVMQAGAWKQMAGLVTGDDAVARGVVPWILPMRGESAPTGSSNLEIKPDLRIAIVGSEEFFAELEQFAKALERAAVVVDKLVPRARRFVLANAVQRFGDMVVLARKCSKEDGVGSPDVSSEWGRRLGSSGSRRLITARAGTAVVIGGAAFAPDPIVVEERWLRLAKGDILAWLPVVSVRPE